jgi:hypothetical protein
MVASLRRRREVSGARATLRRHQIRPREGQANRTPCPTLEGAMHRPGVSHKIRPRPGMAREEVEWEHIAFEAIARTAGRDQVARIVRSAAGQGHDVVEGGRAMIESRGAVHAALPTVAQRRAAQRLFRGHLGRHVGPT